jgi:pyruvate kinase
MFRRTKIVATLGPACSQAKQLEALIAAGVNAFRINFSHGDADDHRRVVATVRAAAERQGQSVAVLADLQGPKIRIAGFARGAVTLHPGDPFVLDPELDPEAGTAERVGVGYPALPDDCTAGDTLLLDDGLIELRVDRIRGRQIQCRVIVGGRLSSRKGINRRGGGLTAPALTDKDRADIATAADMDLDFLAVSFPRDADDMHEARDLYWRARGQGNLVAKIERAEAVAEPATLDSIIEASDGVMVARGDLAVEIGDAELVAVQKHVIQRVRALDRFVITATQMMESMVHAPQPTRAEVSDVANAVLDGTDVVMLSAETAVGDHPETTVRAMDRIIRGAERAYHRGQSSHRLHESFARIEESMALAAMYVANHLDSVKAIIAMTESGTTPRLMSRIRSGMPIFAFAPHVRTRRRVALYRGVQPIAFDSGEIPNDEVNRRAVETLRERELVTEGDRILITKGDYVSAQGGTNALKVVEVGGLVR